MSRFELDDIVTIVGNSLGGLLYVLVPPGSSLGDVQVGERPEPGNSSTEILQPLWCKVHCTEVQSDHL